MNANLVRRLLAAGAVTLGFLSAPSESHAILHWLQRCCQPAVPCAPPVQVAQYVPTVAYRTQYVNVPVTSYRPVASCNPCGGQQVSYMPVTTYATQAQLVPYTTYRIVYSNVAAPAVAAPAVVANYQAPVAAVAQAPCCGQSSAGATYYRPAAPTTAYYGGTPNGYSAYAAPVSAGFGPPSAGLPVNNSAGNLLQSATTGSSLTGIAPTLSPGSAFSSGVTPAAPMMAPAAQMQMMPGQVIQAPAAGPSAPSMQHQQQPTPTPANGGAQQRTYSEEPNANGNGYQQNNHYNGNSTNGQGAYQDNHSGYGNGQRHAEPPAAPQNNGYQYQSPQSPPIQPIPHEESHEPSTDPASGPAIVPPSTRTASAADGRTWTYNRLTYQPGDASAYPAETARSAPAHADPRPPVDDGGWRASAR